MLKLNFLDSQTDIHPIQAIILVRNSIFNSMKEMTNNLNQQILSFIPLLDKSTMNKLNTKLKQRDHIVDIFTTLNFPKNYNPHLIQLFELALKDKTVPKESLIISISFCCIAWYCNNIKNEKDFEVLITYLIACLNSNEKLNFILNYAFKKLLKGSISHSKFSWTPNLFQIIFSLTYLNDSFSIKIYKDLVSFVKIVIGSHQQDSLADMLKLISTLIWEDRQCINWNDINILIMQLIPFINSLNTQTLRILALMSQKTENQTLIDVYELLPWLLLNSLDFDSTEATVFPNLDRFDIIDLPSLQFHFSHSNLFLQGFSKLSFELFDNLPMNYLSILNENTVASTEKVSDCLSNSSPFFQNHFLASFGKLFNALKQSTCSVQICAVFVLIMEHTIQSIPIDIFLSILTETVLLNPIHNIYLKSGFNNIINFLRNRVFSILIASSPHSISSFFSMANGYPFLLTEHLLRLSFLNCDLKQFINMKNARIFYQSTIYLKSISDNKSDSSTENDFYQVEKCRNDNFQLILQIANDPTTFAYSQSVPLFLWLMLEDDLTRYILDSLENGISFFNANDIYDINPTVYFIIKILTKIQKFDISIPLSRSILNGLLANPKLFECFEPVFNCLLNILNQFQNSELLEYCLKFFQIRNRLRKQSKLTFKQFLIMYNSLKKFQISNYILTHLFNLLHQSTNLPVDALFHITCHSFLPLIFCFYANSKRSLEFIQILLKLCKYSDFNCVACHDGEIDSILLEIIQKNSFEYRSISFNVEFSAEELNKVVFPILFKIISVKADHSITYKISEIIAVRNDKFCSEFIDQLIHLKSLPHPNFLIGSYDSVINFNNVPKDIFLSEKFIVNLDLCVDVVSLNTSNCSLTLFSIESSEQSLAIFSDHMSLYIKTVFNGSVNTKLILRVMPFNSFNRYKFEFNRSEKYSLCTYVNGEQINYFDLVYQPFSSETVTVNLGGYSKCSNEYLNTNLATISHFSIQQQVSDRMETFCNTDLIDKNKFNIYKQKDLICFINGQTIEDQHNILFYLSNGNFLTNLCEKSFNLQSKFDNQYLKLIFYVLYQNIPMNNQNFDGIDLIVDYLFDHISLLDKNLFMSVYSILCVIPNKEFALNWFEKLLINTILWSKMGADDFKYVLYFYSRQLIFNHQETFNAKSYFSRFLNHFYLLFCVTDSNSLIQKLDSPIQQLTVDFFDKNNSQQLSSDNEQCFNHHSKSDTNLYQSNSFLIENDLPHSNSFNTLHRSNLAEFNELDFDDSINSLNYSMNDFNDCRNYFILLLKRLIHNLLEPSDIDLLFTYLFSSQSSQTILILLDLLQEIPVDLFAFSNQYLLNLHSYLNGQNSLTGEYLIEIIVHTLLLITKLSKDAIHEHLLCASYELTCYFYSENLIVNPIDLFKHLSKFIKTAPDLFIIFTIYALANPNNDEILNMVCSIYRQIESITFCVHWYIWPILLLFNVDDENKRKEICQFISKMLIKSSTALQTMDQIIDISELILSTKFTKNDIDFEIIKQISLFDNEKLIRHSILRLYYSIFFHFTLIEELNTNKYIINEIIQSDLFSSTEKVDYVSNEKIKSFSLKSPREFERFIRKDFNQFEIRFKVRLDENGHWIDIERARYIVDLYSKLTVIDNKIDTVYKIIQYFIDKQSLSFDQIVIVQLSFESVFKPLLPVYDQQFRDNIHMHAEIFIKLMEHSSKLALLDFQLDEFQYNRENAIKSCVLSQKKSVKTKENVEIKRSSIISDDFCPHSFTIKRKKSSLQFPNKSPIVQYQCNRIKINKIKEYTFILFNDYFCLSNSKMIKLNDISMILTRKRNNQLKIDTVIEIFTVDGRSFLLDFLTVENSVIIQAFLEVPLPSIEFIQKSASSVFTAFEISQLSNKWSNGFISNFDYIMKLNILSGRSFNDSALYPIFPSILASFDTSLLIKDLTSGQSAQQNSYLKDFINYTAHLKNKSEITDKTSPKFDLSDALIKQRNVQPEFFYWSKFLDHFHELPNWSSSKYDFIYRHRKLFESQTVGQCLNKWIIQTFGKNQLGHIQIFPNHFEHPIKKDQVSFDIKIKDNLSVKIGEISSAICLKHDPPRFKFLFGMKNGTVMSSIINPNSFLNHIMKCEVKTNLLKSNENQHSVDTLLTSYEGNVYIYNKDERLIMNLVDRSIDATNLANLANFNYVTKVEKRSVYRLVSSTDYLFATKNSAFYLPDDTTIAKIKFHNQRKGNKNVISDLSQVQIVYKSNYKIINCKISPRFHEICFYTNDGLIHFISSTNGVETNSFLVKNHEVTDIAFAHNLGIIILSFFDRFMLFTIDGEFIKEKLIDDIVIKMFPISIHGIDYIVYQNHFNDLFIFECFYPDIVKFICSAESEVLCFEYDPATNGFIIVKKCGNIFLVSSCI